MKTSVSAKRCPECGRVAALQASECLDCGHQFRTRFEAPDDRTQAFDAVLLPRPSQKLAAPLRRRQASPPAFLFAFVGSFCLVATVGILAWLAWSLSQNAAPTLARAPAATAAPPVRLAGDLYDRVQLSMSLYDVDQTAGGMGRVIHTADPDVLLLSYDFPDQTVHVLLRRAESGGNDFRVQAVALYRGGVLTQRHAVEE